MAEFSIHTKTGNQRMRFYSSDNSNHTIAVKGDSVLSLSMIMQQCIRLEPGDYVDFLGLRFWTTEAYTPKQASTVEWSYDVKFYGVESIIKQALMLSSEGVLLQAYHAPAREQVAMVVMNLNRWMGNITDWHVGACVNTENLDIDYTGGAYCNEALNKISEAAGVEWWMEGMTINLTKAEHTAAGDDIIGIELGYGNGLTSIERDNADNVPFFTRLYPVGSSRNIEYSRYGNTRLQLPSGEKYVERNADKYGVVERYEEEAFSEIYPRRTGTVSAVRTETMHNNNGEFTVYYFSDSGLDFNPNDYEMGGLVKRIVFQDGDVAGRDFEVDYHADTQEFEIITTWPYGDDVQIPGGLLVPKSGDSYVLYDIRMPDEYYPLAEQEFAAAVEAYMTEHAGMTDRSVYKCHTNYIDLDGRGITLTIGQRVRLFSDRFFPGVGYRDSRITRISRKVERPNDADIEISDLLSQTSQSSMQKSIAAVRHEVRTASTAFPDLIRSWDKTLPTDNNLFSARRTLREALSKKYNDSAAGLIKFLGGAEFGEYESGDAGAKITPAGEAEFADAVIRRMLRSPVFTDGFTGEGFKLGEDETGLTSLSIDRLTVRQTMAVMELLINKVRATGGQIIASAANGKIKEATTDGEGNYIICFEQENTFRPHDLVCCSTFTGSAPKSYWVEVAEVDSTNSIIVPAAEFAGEVPAAGDECVLMGNTSDTNRQSLISISAAEDGQPRIDVLNGVAQKNFDSCLRARLGNLDGIRDSLFPLDNQPAGDGLYSDNAFLRGTFLLVTGEDIKTKFEITEGLIQSQVEGVRNDFLETGGYFSNPGFSNGKDNWETSATVSKDGDRTVVFLRNDSITQHYFNMHNIPVFDTTTDEFGVTKKNAKPVYFSVLYRAVTAGSLSVGFDNVDKSGFHNFNLTSLSQWVEPMTKYKQLTYNGLWNGTGSFRLSFTGEIYLYMFVLSTDKAEALKYQYQTLFEQSEKLVKIAATTFDRDGNPLQSSQIVTKVDMNVIASGLFNETGQLIEGAGLITKSNMAGMGVINSTGEIVSFVGASMNGVKIKAKNIQLEGVVTANDNFEILTDGSIKAKNATLEGKITATSGRIGGFNIQGDALTSDYDRDGACIIFRYDPAGAFAGIGTDVLPPSMGSVRGIARFEVDDPTNVLGVNIGICVKAAGGRQNAAILMEGGNIHGFALNCTQVSANHALTHADCFISCYNQSQITLTLPASPETGKIYYIRINNRSGVLLDASTNGHQIVHPNGSVVNTINMIERGELVTVIWDGQYWLYSTTVQ